ncbi:hypothetical protein P7H16_14525 [Paenibacillus larvae]|nr:hypothetical protein [Paenibacillus larvae]MDT2247901.1 hypothetical protein [Paenibacillus larvae]MDT2276750.1 hypothetical protein [Paenibacillus larvae]
MRVDLGCGLQKHPDTWGLDKVEYSGVDAVCDFNKGIPLEDQSVDFCWLHIRCNMLMI